MVLSLAVNSEQIATALASEQQDHLLQHALQARYPLVSRLVELDETQAGKQLLDFIVLYIEAVPKLLEDLTQAAEQAGLRQAVTPLIHIANNFFNLSTHTLGPRSGLTALMVKAYLAHRLLEEVMDVCHFTTGESILPMDLTFTNIIVHTLIGEPFANDMDHLVSAAVAQLLQPEFNGYKDSHSYLEQLASSNLVRIFQEHSSVCGQAGLVSALH